MSAEWTERVSAVWAAASELADLDLVGDTGAVLLREIAVRAEAGAGDERVDAQPL